MTIKMKQDKRHSDHRIKGQWLPTTRKEMDHLGWEQADVILFTGDAYIDHPSMGTAVIGRVLEAHGYKVAIVPQPNWRDDLRDFKKLGRPRLFFGVSAGAMDSMVNHYTADLSWPVALRSPCDDLPTMTTGRTNCVLPSSWIVQLTCWSMVWANCQTSLLLTP